MPSLNKKLFAWFLKRGDPLNHKLYGHLKTDLFRDISGIVLDVGAGTGLNMRYLQPAVTKWIGIEPNTAFHPTIRERAAQHKFQIEIYAADAHHLPFPDSFADNVIVSLVLCSVENADQVVAELYRVIKPGGSCYFIEHVAAPKNTMLRKAQNWFNPLNRVLADGCNCNRDTAEVFRNSKFVMVDLVDHSVKGSMIFHRPHIVGKAAKE